MGTPDIIDLLAFFATIVACLIFRRDGLQIVFPPAKRLKNQLLIGLFIGIGAPLLCVFISYLSGEVDFVRANSDTLLFDNDTVQMDNVGALVLLFIRVAFTEESLFRGAFLIIPFLFIVWIIEVVAKKIHANPTTKRNSVQNVVDNTTGETRLETKTETTGSKPIVGVFSLVSACALITAQAVFFAYLHADNPNFDTGFGLLNIYLAGVMFGFLALKPGSFWLAMFVHFLWNTSSALLGSPVSGYFFDFDAGYRLFAFNESGFWSGGSFGIEGGAACTSVLLFVIVCYSGWVLRTTGFFTKPVHRNVNIS